MEKKYEPEEHVSTTRRKNSTKIIIGTDPIYKKNTTNVYCRKTPNQDNMVRTQFEKYSCNKHYFNL